MPVGGSALNDRLSATISDFTDKLSGVETPDALMDVFGDTVSNLGFSSFAYHMVKVVGIGNLLPLVKTTYPDQWVHRYFEQDYMKVDPVLRASFDRALPYSWDEVLAHNDLSCEEKHFFMEADDFKLRNGLSVPINGYNGEFALMTVVADGSENETRENIAQNRHTLHLLTMYLHNHASSMVVGDALKHFAPTLTKREKEVLGWVADGKTAWEISEILSIGETTAITHIENAKRKLNAPSRTQAVVKAIYLGLIQP